MKNFLEVVNQMAGSPTISNLLILYQQVASVFGLRLLPALLYLQGLRLGLNLVTVTLLENLVLKTNVN